MNEELAYLLGVFAGDGSIGIRLQNHEYVLKCVGNPNDERGYYVAVIVPLIRKVFGLEVQAKLFDKGTTFGIRLHSKTIITFFG